MTVELLSPSVSAVVEPVAHVELVVVVVAPPVFSAASVVFPEPVVLVARDSLPISAHVHSKAFPGVEGVDVSLVSILVVILNYLVLPRRLLLSCGRVALRILALCVASEVSENLKTKLLVKPYVASPEAALGKIVIVMPFRVE